MICPKCQHKASAYEIRKKPDECSNCGVIYQKYLAHLKRQSINNDKNQSVQKLTTNEVFVFLKESFLYLPERTDSIAYWARCLCFVVFVIWGLTFIFQGINAYALMNSFMHNVNLPFHEFGHILFIPLGQFMTILGGSLFQVLLPFFIMMGFVFHQKEIFGGVITLWWTGQSFIDVSPYINDAKDRALPLIGGMDESSHDWGNLLTMSNSLHWTHTLANIAFLWGCLLILLSFTWGTYYLLGMRNRIKN